MNLGIVTGFFNRPYGFLSPLGSEGSTRIFFHQNDWNGLKPPMNGRLVVFDVEPQTRGPRARNVRYATLPDTIEVGLRRTGSVLWFNQNDNHGRVCDNSGLTFTFTEQDICCDELWDSQSISFVGQESPRGLGRAFFVDAA